MSRRREPQQAFGFARPKRTKGGLAVEDYEALVAQLRADAERIAAQFHLPAFELDADRPDARGRYGLCDSEGSIRVRLVNVRTGRGLKYSALIDTVVHELGHLRYMNHGPRWEALYRRMLQWARDQGIYEPRPVSPKPTSGPEVAPAGPVATQLPLFGAGRVRRS